MLLKLNDRLRNFIRNERQLKDIKMADLGEMLGRNHIFIANIENGKAPQIEDTVLRKILEIITDLGTERVDRIIKILGEREEGIGNHKPSQLYLDFTKPMSNLNETFERELKKLAENLELIKDFNLQYVVETLCQVNETLEQDAGLVMGILKLQYNKIANCKPQNKEKFLQELVDLIDEYYYYR